MGKIIVTEDLSLDGVMEAPQKWHFPYISDDMMADTRAQILALEAQLLGRVTYQEFAAAWPTMTNNEFGLAIEETLNYSV